MSAGDHSTTYLAAAAGAVRALDPSALDAMAGGLAEVRARGGRLFILGVGGGAGHASHAVNDFRKLCGIESYAPTDNVSELTARTNDDGWETSFSAWLEVSRLSERDALLVFSVGGGSRERNVSTNLIAAMEAACAVGASIYGVVGAPGGTLAQLANVAISIDPPAALRTPLVESFQAIVWHALVSHPILALRQGHWESLAASAGSPPASVSSLASEASPAAASLPTSASSLASEASPAAASSPAAPGSTQARSASP
jgi:D-sedoheptulose 7-phosphate isomerase